jgi:plastocyanin
MKKLAGRLVVALTVTAAAAAPVACGSDSAGEPAAKPASGKPAAPTDRVVIRNFAFAPTTAAVKAGTKLTFANEDNASHTATSTTGLFDTDGIDKGERATVTLRKPGTYAYYCAFHPYMKGRTVVR